MDVTNNAYNKGSLTHDWIAYQYFQNLQQQPLTPIPIVSAGVFGKSNNKPETLRWTHSWKDSKSPIPPFHDPLLLFHKPFPAGAAPSPGTAGTPATPARLAR